MSSVRSRVEALERQSGSSYTDPLAMLVEGFPSLANWLTDPLFANLPTDPKEQEELLQRIERESEARLKNGDLSERVRARISAEAEAKGLVIAPKTLTPIAGESAAKELKEINELLQRITEEQARRARERATTRAAAQGVQR